MTWNRRILRQLDLKLISLDHSVYSVHTEIGTLQIDRNFILSMLQIQSQLSTLLVGLIHLEEVYKYMTTLSSNVLSPSIISPVDLRQLLMEVEQDLLGHPKLGLPSNHEGKGVWDYYRLLKIKSLVYRDALFVVLSVSVIDKSQTLTVYKIHNLSILVPELCKWFRYNIPNDFIAIINNGLYIMYPDSNEILSCQLSAGHYCEIKTPFYPIDNIHHCSYYLLQNDDEKVRQFCSQRPSSQFRLLLFGHYHHETFKATGSMPNIIIYIKLKFSSVLSIFLMHAKLILICPSCQQGIALAKKSGLENWEINPLTLTWVTQMYLVLL